MSLLEVIHVALSWLLMWNSAGAKCWSFQPLQTNQWWVQCGEEVTREAFAVLEASMWEHLWFPWRSSRGADGSLRSASTGLPCEPTLVILAGWRRSLLAAWSCRTTAAHCHGASWVWGTGLLSQLAPCPQPVAMKLWPHVLRDVRCPRGELCSRGKCHCSCLFLARREMISHPCQSGSFLQHWISASLLNFLFKNPNLRQHSTWHLTLWLPWR